MKLYRTAYVTQPTGHSFAPIMDFCKEVRFITTGYEQEKDLLKVAEESLANYDPEIDVLVPVGSVVFNLILGIFVERLRENNDYKFVNVAVYHDKGYTIHPVGLTYAGEKNDNELG